VRGGCNVVHAGAAAGPRDRQQVLHQAHAAAIAGGGVKAQRRFWKLGARCVADMQESACL
jgi:hypothetical protein